MSAEQFYRDEMARLDVPAHLRDGLVRYLVAKIRPGGFLVAALADDADGAFARADAVSREGLGALMAFLLHVAPALSWGSYELVERWIDRGRPNAHLGAVAETSMHGGEQ